MFFPSTSISKYTINLVPNLLAVFVLSFKLWDVSFSLQSVTELHDGSALFVTVAKYLSPALHDIDQVGIMPDVQCTTEMLNSTKKISTKDKSSVSSLESDSCIMVAERELDMKEPKGTAS